MIVAAVLLGALVHVDWHLGRPAHHPLSGDWRLHWLVGLASGVAYALWAARAAGARATSWFGTVVLLGLVIGQIVEPATEVLFSDFSYQEVMPAVRWRIFFDFVVALLVGGVVTFTVRGSFARRHARAQPQV
jgi:hypothetical protein